MTTGKNPIQRWRFHWRWVVALTLAYFALLGSAIWATVVFDLKLATGFGFFRYPSLWALQLTALYYAVPFVLAFAGGFLMRPFWRHFWATVIAIFAIHGAYSAVAFGLHTAYASEWSRDLSATQGAHWRIESMDHAFVDENGDGLFEDIRLVAQLDRGSLPPADYEARALLSGDTQSWAPQATAKFTVTEARQAPIKIVFELNPHRLKDIAGELEFDVAVKLTRRKELSREGAVKLALCRWAAFCPTGIEGRDPAIRAEWIEMGPQEKVLRFTFPKDRIQRRQVILRKYLGDRGRDFDGDGLFEELVVTIEFDSIYAGPVFFQTYLTNAETFLPTYESRLTKGIIAFDYVIDGEHLRRLGGDGPYRIKNFIMMNNTPYCPQVQCSYENQPIFSVRLSPYTTGSYRADDFE